MRRWPATSASVVIAAIMVAVALAAPSRPDADPAIASEAPPASIEGCWEVRGRDGGKYYDGVVVIKKWEDGYVVRWAVGLATFTGIGLRSADSLSVAWANDKGVRGLNRYRVSKGRLVGKWLTLPGSGQAQPETLTFIRPLAAED